MNDWPPETYVCVGLSFGTNSFKANINFSIQKQFNDFEASYGLGATYYSNYYTTAKKGFEIRNSLMAGYKKGMKEVKVGANFCNGIGEMREFNQRTGALALRHNDFRFSYENDGTPFQYIGLGDGNDSYRTVAASIGIGFSLNMNLFTELRDKASFAIENYLLPGGEKGMPVGKGQFGETYKYGFVFERG